MYDLHLHSTGSDGQLQPRHLIQYAMDHSVVALALTDHDSISGVAEAATEAKALGLEFISGVELSVDFPLGEMHILGYGIQIAEPLVLYLNEQKRSREERNVRILQKLQDSGLELTYDDVLAHALANAKPGEQPTIGRPHFAMALLAKSYVRTISDAFTLYLGKGRPAYVERRQASPAEAIEIIRAVGGVAVLAHPVLLNVADAKLCEVLQQLKDNGLEGIEALHSDHDRDLQLKYRRLASEYDFLVTGGSDFHGSLVSPGIEIGRGKNHNLKLNEMELVAKLQERIKKNQGDHKIAQPK